MRTRTYIDFDVIVDEPFRAILLHSPGRKPWVCCLIHLLSPKRGRHLLRKGKCSCCSAAPTELIPFVVCVSPGFCSCLWHACHPGLCRSVVPTALAISLIHNALTFGENSKYLSSLIRAYTHLNACVRVPFCKLQLKSVQTSAVVCTDYTCSLHRLRRGFNFRKCRGYFLFVNGTVSMCIDGEII